MQLHPIDDQCSSYIKRTRLNDLEAYSIVNQRLVQVNERLRQQRIDEELVRQQQQPIDREIEAQNGKRKRKAAIYSQSDKKYLESQQPKRKKQKLDNKEVSIEVDAQDLFSYELFDKKMRNEVNQNGDDDHDNEEPCNNINNRSMDYKDNEYRRRIGIFRARSGPTRGQLEREKVVPFLLPNNHIRLDDQDNAQVVVPTKLNLTKRVRFSCSYERRIEPHSEMSKAEKDRLWCWCGAKDVDVRSFEQDFVSVWSVANKAHLEHPEVAFYWKADKFRVENAYKNQPSRIGGDIYRGIPTKKAQGVRKLPVITWEGLLGRNAYRSIQPKTKQYIITEAAIRWDKYHHYRKKPGHTWERTGFMK